MVGAPANYNPSRRQRQIRPRQRPSSGDAAVRHRLRVRLPNVGHIMPAAGQPLPSKLLGRAGPGCLPVAAGFA